MLAVALRLPAAETSVRVTRRVDRQFDRGLLDEIRGLLARGVPENARPFGGLVYRQALEHLHGVRDEASTRALIAQENRRYARRQLIWFRKEPNLTWFDGPGETPGDSRCCHAVPRGAAQLVVDRRRRPRPGRPDLPPAYGASAGPPQHAETVQVGRHDMTIREQLETREREVLAPQAARSAESRGRLRAGARKTMCGRRFSAIAIASSTARRSGA